MASSADDRNAISRSVGTTIIVGALCILGGFYGLKEFVIEPYMNEMRGRLDAIEADVQSFKASNAAYYGIHKSELQSLREALEHDDRN